MYSSFHSVSNNTHHGKTNTAINSSIHLEFKNEKNNNFNEVYMVITSMW